MQVKVVYPLSATTILTKCTKDQGPLCNSRGSCQTIAGGYSCSCLTGWLGTHCETNTTSKPQCMPGYLGDYCNTSSCGHGSVINNKTYFECICDRGWTHESRNGTCINVDECKVHDSICRHNGTCIDTQGSYKCNCTPEWIGFNCTHQINNQLQCTDCEEHTNTDTTPIIIGCVVGGLMLVSLIGVVIYMNKRSRPNRPTDTVPNDRFRSPQTVTDTQPERTASITHEGTHNTSHSKSLPVHGRTQDHVPETTHT